MKILLVSKEWFPTHCTGLGIATKMHEKIEDINLNGLIIPREFVRLIKKI
jgi:hypothetical protein